MYTSFIEEKKQENTKIFEKFLPLKRWRHFLFSDGIKFFENDLLNPDLSILDDELKEAPDYLNHCAQALDFSLSNPGKRTPEVLMAIADKSLSIEAKKNLSRVGSCCHWMQRINLEATNERFYLGFLSAVRLAVLSK